MLHRIGFTLVEILLVIFILSLLAVLGMTVMRGTLAQQQLKYSANLVRGEWRDANVLAMEEGQILCMRGKIGGSTVIIDRVLDTHFTAGLSSRKTTTRFDANSEYDSFEKGGFTGEMQDFILRDPDLAMEHDGVVKTELPSTVTIADVIAVAEERSAFYLGLSAPSETETTDNNDMEIYNIEALLTGEIRLGETSSTDGTVWSTPIFFYPDGSTSTAAILLKNDAGRCIEIRLRGLTGTSMATEIKTTNDYIGELDVNRFSN